MPDVYVGGRAIRLGRQVGKGGEAEVYEIAGRMALKLYKPPDHIDYSDKPLEQETARRRLAYIGDKLRALPKGLPSHAVTPVDLVTTADGQHVVGYTMILLPTAEVIKSYSMPRFRASGGVGNNTVVEIFIDLHRTVVGTHQRGVIFGDFNDLNVLVQGNEAFVVDIDASQFGRYINPMFVQRFVDPLLCDPKDTKLMLVRQHNELSDWYAYTAMLFQSLLYVGPYGGVYRPKTGRSISLDERPLHRITIFHQDIVYPKVAIPYSVLSDDLLEYFHRVFEKDFRGEFPLRLLQDLRWTVCQSCGVTHARRVCPVCSFVAQMPKIDTLVIRGNVKVERVFRTSGHILFATVQGGKILYLYHQDDTYLREGGRLVKQGPLNTQNRFRIRDNDTLVGSNGRVAVYKDNPDALFVDSFGTLPVFDANNKFVFWTDNGELKRNGKWGPERIGAIISGQTLFWVGPTFGFGFYQAGNASIHFVFDTQTAGINDQVKLNLIRGQLIDSTAVFTDKLCWFFTSSREGADVINRCSVIRKDGTVLATAEAREGDGSWLENIRGKCAASDFLLAATDNGIVRIKMDNDTLVVDRQFPDTEPFVDSDTLLLAASDGLYAVTGKEVLKISIG